MGVRGGPGGVVKEHINRLNYISFLLIFNPFRRIHFLSKLLLVLVIIRKIISSKPPEPFITMGVYRLLVDQNFIL